MDRVRIGIIGAGFMGKTHAEAVSRYGCNAQLVAIAGGRHAAQLAAEYGVDCEESVERLVERKDIDAVIITTPHVCHAPQGLLAAQHGKHVLVEKPLGIDLEECDRLIATCQAQGVNLMTAQTQRFREGNRVAKRLIESGAIGQVIMVEEEQHALRPADLHDSKESCGRLLGHGIHSPDRLRWFLNDEAEWVSGFSKNYLVDSPYENSSMTLIQFSKGTMATVWVDFESPQPVFPKGAFHVRLVGEKGLLDVDSYGQVLQGSDQGWELVFQQEPFDFQKDPLSPVRMKSFALQDQDFIDSILEQRPPSVTGQDGRAAVEIVLAAYESQRTRTMVHLHGCDPHPEAIPEA